MEPKIVGLVALVMLCLGLAFIPWRWPEGKHLSFSQHVAISKTRRMYYVLLFGMVLPLLLLFFFDWYIPHFQLNAWFGIFLATSAALQFGCAVIPEIGGWKSSVHRLLAGLSAILLLPLLISLLANDGTDWASSVLIYISLATMVGVICLLAKSKGEHSHLLILQCIYFTAFFVPIVYMSYLA